jgi:hypothetical protein
MVVMQCPRCGAENPDGAQYCNLCLSSVGFVDLEFTTGEKTSDGFLTSYPSSLRGDADDQVKTSKAPRAEPVDIGEYGVRSGEKMLPSRPVPPARPVDIGH